MQQQLDMDPAATLEAHRGRLFGLAYRMLGSRAEAEDLLQEAYLRWHQADRATIDNPEAWLVTATTRLAIDRLRRLKTEREAYVGPWLPEPIVAPAPAPDAQVALAEDLSLAFLTLLERLAPEERAAFLLHDVFDVGYAEIAASLGKSEAASRQIVSRARDRVRGDRKRFDTTPEAKQRLLQRFLTAVDARDEQALLALFAPEASWIADGGGKVAASRHPILGAQRIVTLVLGLREKFWADDWVMELASVNGEPGVLVRDGDRLVAAMAFDTDGDRIVAAYTVVNPEKLPSA